MTKNQEDVLNNPDWLKGYEGFAYLSEEELTECLEFMKFFCSAVFEIMCNKKREDYEEDST